MTVEIRTGDCREVLRAMPDDSVHCVVTSPPYWGLRDYGTAKWEGGEAGCDHSPEKRGGRFATPTSEKQRSNTGSGSASAHDCPCGAIRIDSQLGLEQTPDEYVAGMVAVFREVRRVLRADGTLWLNLGDSYGSVGGNTHAGFNQRYSGTGGDGSKQDAMLNGVTDRKPETGMRAKNLIGIPWRVAFALQADGWWLRQDIIWSKPNPMPESVTDRCTKAHEYLFLLTKSAKYYYDADAIAEEMAESSIDRLTQETIDLQAGSMRVPGKTNGPMKAVGKVSAHMEGTPRNDGDRWRTADGGVAPRGKRNKRSVWTVTTQPFSEAHFATFPPALIEPCILAGCPEDGTVLDPFGGAGTTGLVADRHHRNAILIELNPEYAAMAERRIRDESPLFAQVTA